MRKLHRPLVLFAALALCTVARPVDFARAARPGPSSPNILVIMVDDVGADQLACYDQDPGVAGSSPEN